MNLSPRIVPLDSLPRELKSAVQPHGEWRLGLLTSLDGSQLITLLLQPVTGEIQLWESPIEGNRYHSLTDFGIPQAHWFERGLADLFGLFPEGHPRLKHLLMHDQYPVNFHPLRKTPLSPEENPFSTRRFPFLEVSGEGVFELPVGPIHAGVIEPGHFRFSCFGETILNLEIMLGWVHRGVEKRMTEVPWQRARFVAEAAAGDTVIANALAHSIVVESLLEVEVPRRAQLVRTIALELERLAMHIIDVGGLATDIGLLGIAASMSRLRGKALGMGERLTGTRFMKAFVQPGGVRKADEAALSFIGKGVQELRKDVPPAIDMLFGVQAARERMSVGKVSHSLAVEFGFVGILGRGSGVEYDARTVFPHGAYPQLAPKPVIEQNGDIRSRGKIRAGEISSSLDVIAAALDELTDGPICADLPRNLPADKFSCAIVEAFRGELIHLACTDKNGAFHRYAIKDPSFNNWTAISIAIRNNLIADFPLCNKSMSLSYSGNDL